MNIYLVRRPVGVPVCHRGDTVDVAVDQPPRTNPFASLPTESPGRGKGGVGREGGGKLRRGREGRGN